MKNSPKSFLLEVFGATFFQKGSAVPTAKLGVCDIKIVTAYPESAVPTAKLDVCDIKIVSAYPDGVIKKPPDD